MKKNIAFTLALVFASFLCAQVALAQQGTKNSTGPKIAVVDENYGEAAKAKVEQPAESSLYKRGESVSPLDGTAEFACRFRAVGLVSDGSIAHAVGHACCGGCEGVRTSGTERHAKFAAGHSIDGYHVASFSGRPAERRFRAFRIRRYP